MDKLEMAKQLLADKSKTNPGQTTTAYGTATEDSAASMPAPIIRSARTRSASSVKRA